MPDDDLFAEIGEGFQRPESVEREDTDQPVPVPITDPKTQAAADAIKRILDAKAKGLKPVQPSQAQSEWHVQQQSHFLRRRLMAVAWTLGVSYKQMSAWFKITPATIRQAILKELPPDAKRITWPTTWKDRLSFEVVAWYLNRATEHTDIIATMSPWDAANWLVANHPFPGD